VCDYYYSPINRVQVRPHRQTLLHLGTLRWDGTVTQA